MMVGILLGVLVWAGLLFYGDAGAIVEATADLGAQVLLATLAISSLNFVFRAFRWQQLLRHVDVHVPMAESSVIFLAGLSMTLTPMKVGEILKSVLLKQSRGISRAVTAPVVMVERITDLVAMVLLASLGSLALSRGYYIAMLGALFVTSIVLVCTVRPVGSALFWAFERTPFVRDHVVKLRDAYDHLGSLVSPAPFALATLWALVAWAAQCVALLLLVRSFEGVTLSLAGSFLAYSTPLLAGTLSMLPGGLGLTEASMTGLLQELGGPGMTAAIAAAATILIRLVTFWWAIAVGFGALAYWRRAYATTPRVAESG